MSKRVLDQRWPWLLAAGGIFLFLLSTMIHVRTPGDWDDRPMGSVEDIPKLRDRKDLDVLFVLIDTMRAERLSAYGYERDTSPTLARMAASGVRFGRQLSQSSWTKASMASLWSGFYPVHTGITRFDHVVPETARMPAEIFRDAGFHTVGIYRNGWVAPTFGFDQGFDAYQRPAPTPLPPGIQVQNPTLTERGTDESAVDSALEFLRLRGREDRWFLYLHLMDLHEYLYDEKSALFGSDYSDIYDNSIRWTDHVVELLLSSIADLGLLDHTLVVIASDHGEAFGERGFEGHARKVYRETTEVPFFLFLPFRLDPGIVVETRTRNVDIWPTVLDLVGLEPPPSIDGRSRVPEILAAGRGESPPAGDADQTAIAELDQNWARPHEGPELTVAVAQGPLRYVRVEQPRGVVEQLYDASDDPLELRDRAKEEPEAFARLAHVAKSYLEEPPAWGAAPTREINELELNHLRALGYVIQ